MKNARILQKKDFDKICRCCLKKGPSANIFELQFEKTLFFEIMQCLFCSEIKVDDGLPNKICQQCIGEVVRCYSFKRSYDMAEAILLGIREISEEVEQEENDKMKEYVEQNCLRNGDVGIQFNESIDFENTSMESVNTPSEGAKHDKNPINLNEIIEVPLVKKSVKKASSKEKKSPEMIACSCLKVFANQSEYYMHKRRETGEHRLKYRCEVCKKFISRGAFVIHMRTHTKEKPYKCDLCPLSFSSDSNFYRHKRIHTGEKPYVCEHCGKAFNQSTALVYHRRTHTNEKPYLCASCGQRFGNPSVLNFHIRNSHKKESTNVVKTPDHSLSVHNPHKKTYLCTYCGKSLATFASFQRHTFGHTGERPYKCAYCDRKFKQPSGLRAHTFTHTGERPYVCKICQKGFAQGQQLKSHIRTHSGEKPYKCKFCEKAFAHQTTYIVHVRTHTGERPYVCDGCHKGFYHSSSMKKHRRQYCKGTPSVTKDG